MGAPTLLLLFQPLVVTEIGRHGDEIGRHGDEIARHGDVV